MDSPFAVCWWTRNQKSCWCLVFMMISGWWMNGVLADCATARLLVNCMGPPRGSAKRQRGSNLGSIGQQKSPGAVCTSGLWLVVAAGYIKHFSRMADASASGCANDSGRSACGRLAVLNCALRWWLMMSGSMCLLQGRELYRCFGVESIPWIEIFRTTYTLARNPSSIANALPTENS